MIGLIFDICVFLLFVYFIFNLFLKITDQEGKNQFIDNLTLEIKKVYEFIRQRIRKKGNKVDANGGTVYNGPEVYDSSSEWED